MWVEVRSRRIDAELAHRSNHLGGERLIDLDQAESLIDRSSLAINLREADRADAHEIWIDARVAIPRMRPERQSVPLSCGRRSDKHRRCAVIDA